MLTVCAIIMRNSPAGVVLMGLCLFLLQLEAFSPRQISLRRQVCCVVFYVV